MFAEHRGDGQTGVVLSNGSINATPASVNAEMKFDNEKFKLPICLPVSSEDNSLWNEVGQDALSVAELHERLDRFHFTGVPSTSLKQEKSRF